MTQCLFPTFSELQLWEDGVDATSRHRDAVDVAVRESTHLVSDDGVHATQDAREATSSGRQMVTAQ